MKAERPISPSSPFSPFSFLGCCQYYCRPCCPAWGPPSLPLQAAMHFPSYIILKSLHLSLTFTLWSYCTVCLLISTGAPHLLFELLSPPRKPATNHLPYLLLSWCHMSSAPAPSHRNHSTIFCFFHPHIFKISILSCKALPKAVSCIFLHAGLAEPPWIGTRAIAFSPQFVQYTSQGIQRKAVYPDTQKQILSSWQNMRSSVWHLVSSRTVKQNCLAIHKENVCFKRSLRISPRCHWSHLKMENLSLPVVDCSNSCPPSLLKTCGLLPFEFTTI